MPKPDHPNHHYLGSLRQIPKNHPMTADIKLLLAHHHPSDEESDAMGDDVLSTVMTMSDLTGAASLLTAGHTMAVVHHNGNYYELPPPLSSPALENDTASSIVEDDNTSSLIDDDNEQQQRPLLKSKFTMKARNNDTPKDKPRGLSLLRRLVSPRLPQTSQNHSPIKQTKRWLRMIFGKKNLEIFEDHKNNHHHSNCLDTNTCLRQLGIIHPTNGSRTVSLLPPEFIEWNADSTPKGPMRSISATTKKKVTTVSYIPPTTTFTTVASSSTCMDETNYDGDIDDVHQHSVDVLRVHSSPQLGRGTNHNPRSPVKRVTSAGHDHDDNDDDHHSDQRASSVRITDSALRRSMFAYDNMWDPVTKSFVQLAPPKISATSSCHQPTTSNERPAVLPHNDSLTGSSMETQPTSNVTATMTSGPQAKSKSLTSHWKKYKQMTKKTKSRTTHPRARNKIAATTTTAATSVSGQPTPCNVTKAINTSNANSKSSQSSSSGLMINHVQQQQGGTMNITTASDKSVAPQTDVAMLTLSSPTPATTPTTATSFPPIRWYQKLGHVAENVSLTLDAATESLWNDKKNLQSPSRQHWNRHDTGNNKSHPLQNQTSHPLSLLSCTSGACVAATTALEDHVTATPKINNFQRRVRSKSLGSLPTVHSSDSTKLYHLNQFQSRNPTQDDDEDDAASPCTEITLEASSAMITSWSSSSQPQQQKPKHGDKTLEGNERFEYGNVTTTALQKDVIAVDTEFQPTTKRNTQYSLRLKKQLLVSKAKRWSSQSGRKQLPPPDEEKSRDKHLPHNTATTRTTFPFPSTSSSCSYRNNFMQTPIGELLNQPILSFSSVDSIPGNNSCNAAHPKLVMPGLSLESPHPEPTSTTVTTRIHNDDRLSTLSSSHGNHNQKCDEGSKNSINVTSNSWWPAPRQHSSSSMAILESFVVGDETEQKETEKENLIVDAALGVERTNKDFVKDCLGIAPILFTQTPTKSSALSTTATITPEANKSHIDHQMSGNYISPTAVTTF